MRVTLTVGGPHAGPLGPHATRGFGAEGGTIGRSPEADWPLPDPNRFLSQFHARITWQDEAFWLEDTSSNGVFVNGALTALGRGGRHRLAEGDRLALGDYALIVSLAVPERSAAGLGFPELPLPSFAAMPQVSAFVPVSSLPAPSLPSPSLPTWPEAPPPLPAAIGAPPVMPGAAPPNANQAPPAAPGLDAELAALLASFGAAPPAGPASPPAAPALPPAAPALPPAAPAHGPAAATPPPIPPTVEPPMQPMALPLPPAAQFQALPLPPPAIGQAMPLPRPALPMPPPSVPGAAPAPRPAAPSMPSELPPELLADLTELPMVSPGAAAGAAIPLPRRASRAARQPRSTDSLADASDLAFWRGLGLEPDSLTPEQREAALEAFGRALRAAADGLVALLGARRFAKSEFDLEQTQLAAADNNVFKFSPSGEAALRRLMENESGFVPVDLAVSRAFDDLRAHELATAAGVQAALSAMLDRVAPGAIERRFAPIRGGLFTSRKARLWELYTTLHAEIADGAESRFKDVFSRSFASAYDQRARQAARPEDR